MSEPAKILDMDTKELLAEIRNIIEKSVQRGALYKSEQDAILNLTPRLCDEVDALQEIMRRIEVEAESLGADKCPPAPHACPKCEILFLVREYNHAPEGD